MKQTKEQKRQIALKGGYGRWMKGRKLPHISESNKRRFKGKTYEEIYGVEKAQELKRRSKERQRNYWKDKPKKYDDRPHQGSDYRYDEWRTTVFSRDNWTCQTCHFQGYVEAHHIKRWSLYPELRYVVNNGVTLCKSCHKEANKLNKK